MKASEMKDMTAAELTEKLSDLKENPVRLSAVKKDIARVKTLLRQNELKSAQ